MGARTWPLSRGRRASQVHVQLLRTHCLLMAPEPPLVLWLQDWCGRCIFQAWLNAECAPCVPSLFSRVRVCAILWTVGHWASLSMGFSRQEYWSGLPCLPPEDFPDPGIEATSLMSSALAGRFFITSTTWEAHGCSWYSLTILFISV